MSEDREQLISAYRAMREDFLDAIEGLSDDLMTERSHNGWSVKDHMAHIALWDDFRAAEVIRIGAGYESVWRLTPEQDEALNEMATEARWNLSLDQIRWEFAESKRRFMDALAGAPPEALDASKYGEAGLVSRHEAEHAGWIREWRAEKGY